MEKIEKMSAWNLAKVGSTKEVIDEAKTKGNNAFVHARAPAHRHRLRTSFFFWV